MGDLIFNCVGGTAGQPIPLQTVTLQLSTPITGKIVGSGNVSEALLMIDDPFPSFNAVGIFNGIPAGHADGQLACLASNDTNCAIVSPGSGFGSAGPYNGSSGYYNVFQGVQTGGETITWTGVPIDAPGTAFTRIIRITNIRGNASSLGLTSGFANINATVAFGGQNGSGLIGTAVPGFNSVTVSGAGASTQCAPPTTSISVAIQEGFAYDFKPQSYGQVLAATAGTYTGPSAAGSDQNEPGAGYNTESAFRPDPGIGGSSFVDPSGVVGLATQGTQLQLTISGIGAGVGVSVPSYVYFAGAYGQGSPVGVAALTGQSAPAVYTSDGTQGVTGSPGPNVALTVTGSSATAIYEIYYADPSVMETATVPVAVSYAPGLAATGTSTVTVSYAPLSANPNASSSDPIPRFTQTETPQTLLTIGACANPPSITSLSPAAGVDGSSVPVTFTGANFASGATISVSNPAITVSNVSVVSDTQITATFNIGANATPAAANVTVTTAAGTSAAATFTNSSAQPTLTLMTPTSIAAGSTVNVTLYGNNFGPSDSITVNNSAVTVSNVVLVSSTEITATFTVAANASAGTATVAVSVAGGLSAEFTFAITAAPPAIIFISPNSASVGSTVPVTITGNNFVPGSTVTAGAGVTVSNVIAVSATEITATFTIAANAPAGPVAIVVGTSAGNSNQAVFTISGPPPPITLSTASLAFSYVPGDPSPSAQSFGVLSAGGTAIYSVSISTVSGGNWLSAATATGATPGNVMVSVQNLATLSAGSYQGTVTVQPQDLSMPAQR
jgi:hypothetical protein